MRELTHDLEGVFTAENLYDSKKFKRYGFMDA